MNRLLSLLPAGLLGLLLSQSALAQPGARPGAGRLDSDQPGRPGLPISDLTLLDLGAPAEPLRLAPLLRLRAAWSPLEAELAPNPTAGPTALHLDARQPLTITLTVRDVLGRVVLAPRPYALAAGPHALPLDLAGQPAGVYLVTAETGDTRVIQQLLKQ